MSVKYVVTIEGLGGIHEGIDVPGDALPTTDEMGHLWFTLKGKTVWLFNSDAWRSVQRVEAIKPAEEPH